MSTVKNYHGDPEFEEVFEKVKKQFIDWEDETIEDRNRNMRDRDYYDGSQWTQEEKSALEKRGQPDVVFNRIANKVNFVIGTEVDMRIDPRAYPRTDSHDMESEAATDAIRFVAQADMFDEKRTEFADDFFVEGTGAVAFSLEDDDSDVPKIITEPITWDRLYWDPHSRKADFRDAYFMGIIHWMDVDEAYGKYPDQVDLIEATITSEISNDESTQDKPRWWTTDRKRVQIIETFFRQYSEDSGDVEWYECKWVNGGFIEDPIMVEFVDEAGRTWCPIVASSAYVRRGTAETNERYGIVRHMIGPQDEINHRRSKAIHQMHTTGVVAEAGVIEDPDTFMHQLSRPDGYSEVQPGGLQEGRFQLRENHDMVQSQVMMLQNAVSEIDNMGPRPIGAIEKHDNARLFLAHQEAGALELKPIFDNIRKFSLGVYRRYWWLIRQTWTEETWKRITDDDSDIGYRFVGFNRKMTRAERLRELLDRDAKLPDAMKSVFGPDGRRLYQKMAELVQQEIAQQMNIAMQKYEQVAIEAQKNGKQPPPPPQPPGEQQFDAMVTQSIMESRPGRLEFTQNNVSRLDVDLILETSVNSIVVEHEQYQEIVRLVESGVWPGGPDVLKVIIEASSLRNKKKLINMIDKPPSPEEQQQQKQQQELAMAQAQAQVETLQATVMKMQAEAQLAQAKMQSEAAKSQLDQAKAMMVVAQKENEELEPGFREDELDLEQARVNLEARRAGVEAARVMAVHRDSLEK